VTLALDMDTLLASITSTAATISGIRFAHDYDEWPDAPSGMFNREAALHLTGFPEEGAGFGYILRGTDLSEWEIEIPMYTVVVEAAKVQRSRGWAGPYPERYRAAFDTRTSILAVGTGNTGSIIYTGATVVRSIPDWPGYDGFYMLRHRLMAHIKGAVSRS
jgi:hypothetical protein